MEGPVRCHVHGREGIFDFLQDEKANGTSDLPTGIPNNPDSEEVHRELGVSPIGVHRFSWDENAMGDQGTWEPLTMLAVESE